ncbi:hypothetical protein [Actinoplanes auranticolor]|uniref:Uncharacterized protein n=1 Tax=Actinoplanes auranticolor TaxID=47988 RepID=A0A919SN64_9ACTN|nr:hypothetical protein [Actinoplanes auranticolor]GIM75502.1 hypothetical protein Aau02nite_66250 [Actinoplanes auranticolor]
MSDGTFLPSGVTPWSAYNTPRIWAMVEKEDDPEAWRQVSALGSLAGLLHDQRRRLELAKETLMGAWPPEKNKAAAAFVDLIDDLLFNMAENKKVADANAGALAQVLEALRQAKVKVEPLYRSYLAKSDDWVPGWWDNAEDEIDEQARRQMRNAESIVADPGNAIVAPDVYEFEPRMFADAPLGRPGGDGSDSRATPLSAGVTSGISVPHDPPPPLPGAASSGSGAGEAIDTASPSGPSLAGVISPPPIGSPSPAPPPVSGSAAVITTPGLVIGGAGGRSSVGAGQRGLPGSVIEGGAPVQGRARAVKPATPSWLPPATGQPAGRGAGSPAGRASQASPSMMPAPQHPANRCRSGERGQGPAFDPDNPWATEQGVPPVIEPSRRQYRHDPGPGVIGWRQ